MRKTIKKYKEEVTKILDKLGVTMSGLINMTIKQVIMKEGIPLEVTIPKEPGIECVVLKKETEACSKSIAVVSSIT